MAASLKADDETKRSLERLQASLTLAADRKPTMQDLLRELARIGWAHQDEIIARLTGWKPATEDELAALEGHIVELNERAKREPPEPSMSDDDQLVYGGD